MEDLNTKFFREVSKIREAEVFLGVARVLGIKPAEMGEEGLKWKGFEVMIGEVVEAYSRAGRKRKKELLKMLRQANKAPMAEQEQSAADYEDPVVEEGLTTAAEASEDGN